MSNTSKAISLLTPKNLQHGMKAHLSYRDWDPDFHAKFYKKLRDDIRKDGFNEDWWDRRVYNLTRWIAIRGCPKDEIIKRGMRRMGKLEKEYRILDSKNANITSCDWDVAAPLFKVASEIKTIKSKPVGSPAFASKLCHFMMPELFPVFDTESLHEARKLLGFGYDYPKYWNICKDLWNQCGCKQELKKILSTAIQKKGGSTANYPWAVKITGLCLTNQKFT